MCEDFLQVNTGASLQISSYNFKLIYVELWVQQGSVYVKNFLQVPFLACNLASRQAEDVNKQAAGSSNL